MVLRPMTMQDLDAVLELAVTSDGPRWSRQIYEQLLTPGTVLRFAFVSSDGFVLSGFAIASWLPSEETAELETVVVGQQFRRRGVGTALVGACMQAAAEAGAQSIRLEVRESNVAALTLYQQVHFSSVGRRQTYYSGPTEDAILLQARLETHQSQSPL